jgi:hypothetical protein
MNMAAANHVARRAARPWYGHVLRPNPNTKPLIQLESPVFLSTNIGLWFHGGNLHLSRHYSQFLSLQLKARMEGIATPVYAGPS